MTETISTASIMRDFAESTGLTNTSIHPRRYLWTDAFAVCNYLELYRQTGKQEQLQQALNLVDQVHQTLGTHHKDSKLHGWISGLDDEQARLHPTKGGLRIGKKLNERHTDEPFDEQLEWDYDGQYFHYLTKWMHALNRLSQVTANVMYNQWALELAKVAHSAFTYTSSDGSKRMMWKMSIDLTRPQVDSMGHHDPLDGLITYLELQTTSQQFASPPAELSLKTEIEDIAKMCAGRNWATQDSLGIGGLLSDAYRLTQLIANHHLNENTRLELLLNDIELSLKAFIQQNQLHLNAENRLAFRELGLAIGLQGIDNMKQLVNQNIASFSNVDLILLSLAELTRFTPIAEIINSFWKENDHRKVRSWLDHGDINNVMLATSLLPDEFL